MSNILDLSMNKIKEIQSLFSRLGYGKLKIDGILGSETIRKVKEFQKDNGLKIDGIIGKETYKVLENYLNGYFMYTIKPGDTFYNIGKRFNIDYNLIEIANSSLNSKNLIPGTAIVVPYGIEFVPTDIPYTYEILLNNIRTIKKIYPFVSLYEYGTSTLGRKIYGIKIGNGPKQRFFNASHHGLEWITTPILMKFVQDYLKRYVKKGEVGGIRAEELFNQVSMYVMPMVNPDGVTLVQEGVREDNPNYEELIKWNNNSKDFSKTWQANNNGVDINHNYDAGWEEYKALVEKTGYDNPGPSRYPGTGPNSESETRAVINAVNSNNFDLVVAYHTQGEVIYWQFKDLAGANAKRIGEELARVSNYALDNAEGLSSYSGFKDWFILKYRRPGYTIEVGKGENPLPLEDFNDIYKVNVPLIVKAMIIETN